MQISPISYNESFKGGRKVSLKCNTGNIVRPNAEKGPVRNCADSILLYFTALIALFGFNKPFDKLIDKLH